MPYVECPGCSALTYVPRSYLARPERCPACEAELETSALLPLALRRAPAETSRAGLREALAEGDGPAAAPPR